MVAGEMEGGGTNLAVDKGGDGDVPSGVGGHTQTQKGPNPVVVEGGNEDGGGATGSKYVSPGSLVQMVVDIVDVAGTTNQLDNGSEEEEGAVEGKSQGFPVRPQKPIKNLEPLQQFI